MLARKNNWISNDYALCALKLEKYSAFKKEIPGVAQLSTAKKANTIPQKVDFLALIFCGLKTKFLLPSLNKEDTRHTGWKILNGPIQEVRLLFVICHSWS